MEDLQLHLRLITLLPAAVVLVPLVEMEMEVQPEEMAEPELHRQLVVRQQIMLAVVAAQHIKEAPPALAELVAERLEATQTEALLVQEPLTPEAVVVEMLMEVRHLQAAPA